MRRPSRSSEASLHRGRIRDMNASALMTTTVVTATPKDTVRKALLLLEDSDIRHLPIVEGKKLVGLVSDRDLREYRLPLVEEIDDPDYADDLLDTPLSEVMSGDILCLEIGESLKTGVDLMIEYGIGAIPVVDRDKDELVGILSYVDVLKAVRDTL
jgi:acetoin utilization protein AcuB